MTRSCRCVEKSMRVGQTACACQFHLTGAATGGPGGWASSGYSLTQEAVAAGVCDAMLIELADLREVTATIAAWFGPPEEQLTEEQLRRRRERGACDRRRRRPSTEEQPAGAQILQSTRQHRAGPTPLAWRLV